MQNIKGRVKHKLNKSIYTILIFFIIISFVYILSFLQISNTVKVSFANTSYYAKVQNYDAYMYSQPIDESEYMLFEVPRTYFVLLMDEENQDFYYAQYQDVFGYIKVNDVVVMDGIPHNPYFTSNFRIYSFGGLGIYSSPVLDEEYFLTQIPHLSYSQVLYGSIVGQEAIPDKTNIWYYCKYTDDDVTGYVYGEFCDHFNDFNENTEYFNIIENPVFSGGRVIDSLSSVAMTFIVIGVSIPCIIVIYLLVKPTLLKDKVLNSHPKAKKRRGDYYEFDESDLN